MFVKAIQDVSRFTRPIHTITRVYGEPVVTPGAATFFFVNELGCAITCKHVMEVLAQRDAINENYRRFRQEKDILGRNNQYKKRLSALEEKFRLRNDTTIQLKDQFVNCTYAPTLRYRAIHHPVYDLSILVFEEFTQPAYQSFARFKKNGDELQPGKFLCRLGYPFPEFSNFRYDAELDDIEWTAEGKVDSPIFPMEGMITRHVGDQERIMGLELSTPGLRGQSGGPVFDSEGTICGMQMNTTHLHLGFDMKDHVYINNGKAIHVNNQPFLHTGRCLHVNVIKDFLRENDIKFYEEDGSLPGDQ